MKNIFYYMIITGIFFSLNGCLPQAATPSTSADTKKFHSPAKEAAEKKQAVSAQDKTAPKTSSVCGVKITGSREEAAQEYYVKGERMFGSDEISGAKASLQTAVCLNSKHKQATDLLNLLEQTYSH